MVKKINKPPLVSSLSLAMRNLTEDPMEAKKNHRMTLNSLVQNYIDDVAMGKASGIRNAKELADIMKLDLLLLGEVTERTEVSETESDKRIREVANMLKGGELPTMVGQTPEELLAETMEKMNNYNDEQHR